MKFQNSLTTNNDANDMSHSYKQNLWNFQNEQTEILDADFDFSQGSDLLEPNKVLTTIIDAKEGTDRFVMNLNAKSSNPSFTTQTPTSSSHSATFESEEAFDDVLFPESMN